LAYLIVFGSIVAYSAYTWLLRSVSTPIVSTYAYVNPAVAVLLGWLVAGEQITGRTLAAAAVIIAGVALIVSGPRLAARRQRE
jgi:drug/metabolite transporter (DMT)-like permease